MTVTAPVGGGVHPRSVAVSPNYWADLRLGYRGGWPEKTKKDERGNLFRFFRPNHFARPVGYPGFRAVSWWSTGRMKRTPNGGPVSSGIRLWVGVRFNLKTEVQDRRKEHKRRKEKGLADPGDLPVTPRIGARPSGGFPVSPLFLRAFCVLCGQFGCVSRFTWFGAAAG